MREFLNGYQAFLGFARGIEAERRAGEAEAYARMARRRAHVVERHYLELEASGDLGDARLGTLQDAQDAGLFDPAGWYLGTLGGRFLYLNADGHNLIYARTGAGKGVSSVQPNLAHCRDSMFVIDVKGGELHYSTASHREQTLGHKVVTLDPWGITGWPSARISPLSRLCEIVASGRDIDAEADEIALILLPRNRGDAGDNGWVRKGARRLLAMRMRHLAYVAPDRLDLGELWRFVNCSDGELLAAFDEMIESGREEVAGPAAAMRSVFNDAPKQFEAYRGECQEALVNFWPGSSLTRASAASDFDFGEMKRTPSTVYLTVPFDKLGVAAPWLAMLLNHAIEQVAAASGPTRVRFLIDEFAQLPAPIPAVLKALRLYRGRGMLLSMYCQGRHSLEDAGYGAAAVKEIEDQASCIQMWGVEDPSVIKDVEFWSGNSSIVQVNPSHNGGQIAQGGLGRSEQKRPVLQVEDIRRIGDGAQIVKLPGFPLFIADRPSYWHVSPWKEQVRDVRRLATNP